jgi:hypothetical protein
MPALGDGRCGVILRAEDVADCPAHLGAEFDQRLDQHRRLDGHVQRAGDPRALQRLGGSEFLTAGHQPGHFVFGQFDLFAAVSNGFIGQIGDFMREFCGQAQAGG